jgi:DNA-binding NarL/FixJ family response regulator
MTESNRIRVVIVDDDVVLADALHQLWERDGEISIVGVAHTAADGVVLACRERPDVILMDHHLPDMTGASATSAIAAELPSTPIVMLTRDDSDETLLAALEAGASGFLLKRSGIREVSDAIRHAAAGEILIPPAAMARLMAVIRERRRRASEIELHRERLSARELEVLALMRDGLDTRAMANRLGIGQATIRTHASAVLGKLGAHSRLEAVAIAIRLGILG